MKFGKKLATNATPEWQSRFFNYKAMKKKIKHIVKVRQEDEKMQKRIRKNSTVKDKKEEQELNVVVVDNNDDPQEGEEKPIAATITKSDNRFVTEQVEDLIKNFPEESHDFLDALIVQINDINEFYLQKEKEIEVRHDQLKGQIEEKAIRERSGHSVKKKHINVLQRAYQDHYYSLVLLDNYKKLNYAACIKIIKKFSKYSENQLSDALDELVRQEPFISNNKVETMLEESEKIFTDQLYSGKRKDAMNKLRPPASSNITPKVTFSVFRCGLWLGINILLVGLILFVYFSNFKIFSNGTEALPDSELTFFLFRLMVFPIVLAFLISINVYVWEQHSINYIFIFEINPRDHLSLWQYMELTLLALVLWCAFLLFYMIEAIPGNLNLIHPWIIPIVLFAIYVAFLTLPLPILCASSRLWLLKRIYRMSVAPFVTVKFADFWFADQFSSMSDFLYDLQFVFCLYPSQNSQLELICSAGYKFGLPIINIFPQYSRFMQCCRRFYDSRDKNQLVNAGKYLFTIIAMLTTFIQKNIKNNTIHDVSTAWLVIWFSANIFSTLFKVGWDMVMDMGLFRVDGVKYKFLRSRLLYHPLWYYITIPTNFSIRFLWLILFFARSYFQTTALNSQIIQFALAFLEILRRFIWNMFRLENEHLHNAEKYRVVTEIPLPFTHKDSI
ncbi:hypothetical protein AKO1_014851 [Acrasis kona]|uniref:Uncharacterized protein n=1 Tax=Acrasis kona TaxID=1008807 RepID=A0AAW2Z1M3_9EUKA